MIKTLSFSLLTILLLSACGGAAPPTAPASPTLPATPGPSPDGSPTPATPTPATPVPATPSPTPAPTPAGDRIDHPTGADEIVLQYEVGGGFVPMESYITLTPQFSLYGDGTVIFRPQAEATRLADPGALPRLLRGQMDEDGMQALLAFALGQGRLAGAREQYDDPGCADCQTTTFKFNAAGMSKLVSVLALGDLAEGPDAIDRQGFWLLADTLHSFEEHARNGVAGEVTLYDPDFYRVVLSEAQPGMGEPIAWPWPELGIDDFAEWEAGWQRRAALPREQVALLTEVPTGGVGSILVEDPAGDLWTVGARPLLPEEISAEVK
jgi:hypothetical protein